MSGAMYAGHLCATQVGGRFNVGDGPAEQTTILRRVIHCDTQPRVRVVISERHPTEENRHGRLKARTWTEDLDSRALVWAEDPTVPYGKAPVEEPGWDF